MMWVNELLIFRKKRSFCFYAVTRVPTSRRQDPRNYSVLVVEIFCPFFVFFIFFFVSVFVIAVAYAVTVDWALKINSP